MEPEDVISPVLSELRTIRTQLDGIDRRFDCLQVKGARAAATAGGVVATGLTLIRARLGGVMAHSRATREGLRRAYVFGNLSLELAAIQCGVSVHSARRWKKEALDNGDDWEVIRSAHLLASGAPEDIARAILTSLMAQFQETLEKVNLADTLSAAERVELLARLTDAWSKSIAASKKILPETSQLATAMETLKLLSAFIQDKHPRHLAAFVDMLEAFGPVLEKHYG